MFEIPEDMESELFGSAQFDPSDVINLPEQTDSLNDLYWDTENEGIERDFLNSTRDINKGKSQANAGKNYYHEQSARDNFNEFKRKTYTYTTDNMCGTSEIYVSKLVRSSAGGYTKLVTTDLKVYEANRYVYYTGYYQQDYTKLYYQNCFIMYVDEVGTYKGSAVIGHNDNSNTYSECTSLDITENNYVVSVGLYYTSAAGLNPAISGGYGSKTSALIVLTSMTFTSPVVKIWSASQYGAAIPYFSQATDVASTKDGAIYVTGFHAGFSNGGQADNFDCFVLKLDQQLGVVYAKSFGSALDEKCYQITVSRNFDYIYLGGNQLYLTVPRRYRLMFFRLNGFADKITNNRYIYTTTLTYDLQIRRMMVTNPRGVFSGGVDSVGQYIYFCAAYYDTQYDFVYGQLSNTLTLNWAFKYGAPIDDVMGDCSLTEDGRFMMGSFGTNHNQPRSTSVADVQNQYWYIFGANSYADYPVPYNAYDSTYSSVCCDNCCGHGCCSPSVEGVYATVTQVDVGTHYGGRAVYSTCNSYNCGFTTTCGWCPGTCWLCGCGGWWECEGCYSCGYDTFYTTQDCQIPFLGIGGTRTCSKCYARYYYYYYEIINSYATAIRSTCLTGFQNSFTPYLQEYNANVYTWHTCYFYTFDLTSVDCSVNNLRFQYCQGNNLIPSGTYLSLDTNCNNLCHTKEYEYEVNRYKPWYTYPANTNLGVYQDYGNVVFQGDIWYNYLCTTFSDQDFMPYAFCDSGSAPTYDDYDFIFDQDCDPDYTQRSDFFIFKLDLTAPSSASAYVDYQPMNAVYFGMPEGDEQPTAMALDEFGFVYVAGTTTSYLASPTGFGVKGNDFAMLYLKTHWDLNIEMTNGPAHTRTAGQAPQVTSETYLKAKFTSPKKYRNRELGTGNSYGVTFFSDFFPSLIQNSFVVNVTFYPNTDSSKFDWKPQPINERISASTIEFVSSTHYNFYSTAQTSSGLSSFFSFSTGSGSTLYSSTTVQMTQPWTYYFNRYQYYEFNLNQDCASGKTYANKQYQFTVGSLSSDICLGGAAEGATCGGFTNPSGINPGSACYGCLVNASTISNFPRFYGTISYNKKGIYYLDDYLVSNKIGLYGCSNNIYGFLNCPIDNYEQFYDVYKQPSLSRFNFGYRPKIVVNDITPGYQAPYVIANIPDQTPTCGFWTQFVITPATYFYPSTQCTYMYAKQGYNSANTITATTILPYWIQFYEANYTFVLYPPNQSPTTIAVQLYCCDNIDSCASNTFYVTPQNTAPTLLSSVSTAMFVLQYDTTVSQGMSFNWARTSDLFSDADIETSSTIDFYNHMDHTVWLTYTGALAGFKSIDIIGMIYGQIQSTSVFTTTSQPQSLTFKYQDMYMYQIGTSSTSYLSLVMNRLPAPTTVGKVYQFSQVDPYVLTSDLSGKYGKIFPWLKQSSLTFFYLDVSQWFTDADSDTLTYSITYSDGTTLPSYFNVNQLTGEIYINQYQVIASQYMNIKVTGYDTKAGFYSYFKTLLIDTQPKVILPYHLIVCSVGKPFSYYVGDNIIDQNGDQLTWVLPNSVDQAQLDIFGIEFSALTQTIFGVFKTIAFISNIRIDVTDVHGLYSTLYISLTARNMAPAIRLGSTPPEDQTVILGKRFYFLFPRDIFQDTTGGGTLLIYAAAKGSTVLPNWITFNPYIYSFTGLPTSLTTLTIVMTAMEPQSTEIITIQFKVTVVNNTAPHIDVKFINNDLVVMEGSWFQATVASGLFRDKESINQLPVTAQGGNGQDLPVWMNFNKYNKTVYGVAQTPGDYMVDFIYTSDFGSQSSQNMKITVIKKPYDKYPLLIHYVLTLSGFAALAIYYFYVLQFGLSLLPARKNIKDAEKKIAMEAIKRFGKYKDVDLKYFLPDSFSGVDIHRPAITKDFDFLGIDQQYQGDQKFKEQMHLVRPNKGRGRSRF